MLMLQAGQRSDLLLPDPQRLSIQVYPLLQRVPASQTREEARKGQERTPTRSKADTALSGGLVRFL